MWPGSRIDDREGRDAHTQAEILGVDPHADRQILEADARGRLGAGGGRWHLGVGRRRN
jgi:hypothetical protein